MAASGVLLQRHQLLEDAVEDAEHGQLTDLLGHLLPRLEFLEAHEDRALLGQLRRVEHRARGVGLLTTTDHVDLRQLERSVLAAAVGQLGTWLRGSMKYINGIEELWV